MPRYYYDLHIHSALSPCGHEDMTPNNIVNMAVIKGLDIIAITDHNLHANVNAVQELTKKKDILLIPGMEVQSSEEVHLLCLFEKKEQLNQFGQLIYEGLPDIKNDEGFFGTQYVYNEYDECVAKEPRLLCNSTSYTVSELVELVHKEKGIVFAAHVDKRANSLIHNLGFIPQTLKIDGIELSKHVHPTSFFKSYPQYKRYKCIQNSDAHYLRDLSERVNSIELESKTPGSFIDYFRS